MAKRRDDVTERSTVRCLVTGCNFIDVDESGPGFDAAERHADQAGHVVEVKIDAFLTVWPDPPHDDEEEEEAEEDVQRA